MNTLPTDLINSISSKSRSSDLVLLLLPTNYWTDLHEDYDRDPTGGALKVLNDSRLVEYFLTAKNIRYANIWTASLLKGYYDNIRLIVKYLDSIKYGFDRMDADPKYYLTPEPQSECYNILFDLPEYQDLLKRPENYNIIYQMSEFETFKDRIMSGLALAIQNDDMLFVDYLLANYRQVISNYDQCVYKLIDLVTMSVFSSKDRLIRYYYILREYINPKTTSIADCIMDLHIYIPQEQLVLMVEEFHILTWNDLLKAFIKYQSYTHHMAEDHYQGSSGEDFVRLRYIEIAGNMARQNCENIKVCVQFDG